MRTRPTIWCRKRWSRPGTSRAASSRAPISRRGCSRSCATNSIRRCASAAARCRTATALMTARLAVHPAQHGHARPRGFPRARSSSLPEDQREAIILIGASGFSYEEAAEICDCAVGTIKSRVSRARSRLQEILKISGEAEYRAGCHRHPGDGISRRLRSSAAGGRWSRPRDQLLAGIGLADQHDAGKAGAQLVEIGVARGEDERRARVAQPLGEIEQSKSPPSIRSTMATSKAVDRRRPAPEVRPDVRRMITSSAPWSRQSARHPWRSGIRPRG